MSTFTAKIRGSSRQVLICLALFGVTFGLFVAAPVQQIADSRYSLMLSEHLLKYGEFDLQNEFKLPLDPERFPALGPTGYPATMLPYGNNGQVFYGSTDGSSILSIPLLVALRPFGVRVYKANGQYDAEGEVRAQMLIAAMIMSALCVVIYLTGLEFLTSLPAFLIALTAAFATQLMSTATRSLWSHGWMIFLLGLAILILVRAETAGKSSHPIILATLLSWMYFVRPAANIPILCITIFFAFRYPRRAIWFAITGAAWLALFIAHARAHYGLSLPPYYQLSVSNAMLAHDRYLLDLYTLFFGASRGEFITVPAVLVALYFVIRYRPVPKYRALCMLAAGAILLHSLLLARYIYGSMYGSACFGARYFTDLIPWFALLGIIGLAGRTREARPHRRSARLLEWTLITILILISGFINLRGAFSQSTWGWNARLIADREQVHALVTDWRYPQWMAGLIPPPLPAEIAMLPVDTEVMFGADTVGAYFREQYGWGGSSGEYRRTIGTRADFVFALREGESPAHIEMRLQPYLVSPQLMHQRLRVVLNGSPMGEITLSDYLTQTYRIVVPPGIWRPHNLLTLSMPDAKSPKALGLSLDDNAYGISLYWLKLSTGVQPQVDEAKKIP